MKKFILSLIVMFAASATVSMAQDDMYFVPKKETKEEKAKRKAMEDSLKVVEKAQRELAEKIAFEQQQRAYEDMMVRLYRRLYHEDVDLYNRHYSYETSDSLVFDSLNTGDDRVMFSNVNDTLYNVDDNYKFLKMISRFDDLDIRYYPYDNFYRYDPWYDYPSHYWGWNYGYHHFYNPFSPYWRYGYYDPFYYGRDPWWYTWYDPYYDGFYGWGWHHGWGYRPYYDVYYHPNYGYIGHSGSLGSHHGTAGTNLPAMAGTTNHGGWNSSSRNRSYGMNNGGSSGSYGGGATSTPRNSYWGNSSGSRISTSNSGYSSSSSSSSSSSRSYATPSTSHSSGFSGGSRSSGGGGGFSGGSRGGGGGSRSTGGRH